MSGEVQPGSASPHARRARVATEASLAPEARVLQALDRAARLLPGQGPITVFVHHNPLHAFEHLPFEEAVVAGGALFGCEPLLPEATYRRAMKGGQIRWEDAAEELRADGGSPETPIAAGLPRGAIREALLRHGLIDVRERALDWMLDETPALRAFREDVPAEARARLLLAVDGTGAGSESRVALALWTAACAAVARASAPDSPVPTPPLRHRDILRQALGVDLDKHVQPVLIRVVAAFLDQGVAYWQMPNRERGIYACMLDLYGQRAGPPDRGLGGLAEHLRDERALGLSPLASVCRSLDALGVRDGDLEAWLTAELLALRGWAGMVRQIELRPDRVPVRAPPARLVDYLAVSLLLLRLALARQVREQRALEGVDPSRPTRDALWNATAHLRPAVAAASPRMRAWHLHQLAQLVGLLPSSLDALQAAEVTALLGELSTFDGLQRRRLLHQALERGFRREVFTAAATPRPAPEPARDVQMVLCLDEREESLRRHLEEADPDVETLGAPGFFGVAMHYFGAEEAHPRPLCPVAIRPDHLVREVVDASQDTVTRISRVRHALAQLDHAWVVGSKTLFRGSVITATLGALATVPLMLRVLFPRLAGWFEHTGHALVAPPSRRHLALDQHAPPGPDGQAHGFTKAEMAAIVRRQLEDIGLARRAAPLVVVIGHGSSSLNNPHESAHDCGACGGGRGGPNARAFAQMANDPEVRALLAADGGDEPGRGVRLSDGTWFVGAYHNTCDDSVTFFDLERVPHTHLTLLDRARRALEEARTRDAHERHRRLAGASVGLSPRWALRHVQARAEDLAQPRPEYGHATNALCLVGRRARSRGLFLDRRAFLMSYDPHEDDATGTILARVLAAVVPVVAGINLEYFFSFVDPTGYGCGTKLPHNVTGLLGVMDGHQSDLRTGLPWQMVEIHQPVRLPIVIEASTARLDRVLDGDPNLRQLVRNRWVWLAALDPESAAVWALERGQWVQMAQTADTLPVFPSSGACYRGREDPVPFARIDPAGTEQGSLQPPGRAEGGAQ